MKPIVIGIAGGSCSGKTTVTQTIKQTFHNQSVVVIEQDYYYKDQSHLTFEERLTTNYDHPSAFDNDLLIAHLETLLKREPINKPVYDYVKHTRAENVEHIAPADVIIVEGMLILDDERLRNIMDMKIFVDTDSDLRIIRRILRDIKERGRTTDSVIDQYLTTVRTSHIHFIEPTKRFADIILPEG
ncbi:MAG TPA: uridine kinase, partial [Metalysinibacillus jejuensis]|nr:uridine kinase [Metalysinibacillus jejuensis]